MLHVFDTARRKHFLSSALRRSCTIASILPSPAPRSFWFRNWIDLRSNKETPGFPFYSSGTPKIRGTLLDEELSNILGAEWCSQVVVTQNYLQL